MNTSRIKGFIHAFQAFLIFIGWALTIAVFTRVGKTDGRTAWFFALVGDLLFLAFSCPSTNTLGSLCKHSLTLPPPEVLALHPRPNLPECNPDVAAHPKIWQCLRFCGA